MLYESHFTVVQPLLKQFYINLVSLLLDSKGFKYGEYKYYGLTVTIELFL